MDLQELISRGRFLMADAPARLRVFRLVNGKRTSLDISKETGRRQSSVNNDLTLLADGGLIRPRQDREGNPVTRDRAVVYEKIPLARTVSLSFFSDPTKARPSRPGTKRRGLERARRRATERALPELPREPALLDIFREGEEQRYEFKAQGVEPRKLAKEAAAMLNTSTGGVIFYGIEDDGTIQGSDRTRQDLDQSVQSALRDLVDPAPVVGIRTVGVLGHQIAAILVPPWDGRNVYQYHHRVLIRKGTTITNATAAEARQLHEGRQVI